MWTPQPWAEFNLPPSVPHASVRTGTLSGPGTVLMAMSCLTHTGLFKVSLHQLKPSLLKVWTDDPCQSVVRTGEPKPDKFYSQKQQGGFCEGKGCFRTWDGKAHALQAYRSDSGTEFMPTLINAGVGDGEGTSAQCSNSVLTRSGAGPWCHSWSPVKLLLLQETCGSCLLSQHIR